MDNLEKFDLEKNPLTPEETELKEKITEKVINRKKVLMVKMVVLCMLLVEAMDELETYGYFRQMLKRTGKIFMTHLIHFIEQVFNIDKNDFTAADYLAQKSKEIDKILE